MQNFIAKNLKELEEVSKELIPYIIKNKVVAFYGKMGVGKTTLIKSICNLMQVNNTVTSPTFALVNEYSTHTGELIYHFDFYRVNKTEEIFDLGYEEYFYSGNFCFIEWPELAESVLLPDTLKIKIEEKDKGKRQISIE